MNIQEITTKDILSKTNLPIGDYRGRILNWVHDHCPDLNELYRQIYTKKDRTYWSELDGHLRSYCEANGFRYVRNDDSHRAKHGELPVVVNYFYHETITKSAQRKNGQD